jgi:hypothetical protein
MLEGGATCYGKRGINFTGKLTAFPLYREAEGYSKTEAVML